jgi:hypothetical protein
MSVCRATIEGNDDDGSLTKLRECKLKKEATIQLTGVLVDSFPDVWYVSEVGVIVTQRRGNWGHGLSASL